MATLVPCLVALRSEFNELFPLRDKASDGWIGDPAHAARPSDHNPDRRGLVHAIDVDAGLSGTADMWDFVATIVERCRSGSEKRLTYVIYNRRIWSAAYAWGSQPYSGASPHTEHAHFSADDLPAREQNVSNWRLEEVPVALTGDDKKWIEATVERIVEARVGDVVQRYDATGQPLPAGDPNPKMTVPSALGYIGRDVAELKRKLA